MRNLPGGFTSSLSVGGPGRHTLRLTARVDVFYGNVGATTDPSAATPAHRHQVVLTAETEVLAAGAPDDLTTTRDSAMGQQLRARITPENFWWITLINPRGELSGGVDVGKAPANIAFAVIARAAGKEHALGSMTLAKGERNSFFFRTDEPALASADQIDLILRTSADAARGTVDLYDVWDGELVFPGVPVRKVPGVAR
jgi:hypothetical protein